MQNIENKMQISVKKFQDMGWNVRAIECYRFASQSDCLKMVEELSGLKEGVVVYNARTLTRIKIKNQTYLAAHRLRSGGLTLNSICELTVMNEQDEYLAVFPEDAPKFDDAMGMFSGMMLELINYYDQANRHMVQFDERTWNVQKEFALFVKDLPLSGCMFMARRKGTDPIHEFNQLPVGKRADYLKERLV